MNTHGETIELTMKQMRFFGADSPSMPLNQIDTNTPMDDLVRRQKKILRMLEIPQGYAFALSLETHLFNKREALFVPVASAILEQEIEIFLDQD